MINIFVSTSLIAVSEAPHTRHHAQHIVVSGEHIHLGRGGGADRIVGHRQEESGVINAG